MTWPSNAKFGLGGTYVLTTTAAALDAITFVWDGTNWREVSRAPGRVLSVAEALGLTATVTELNYAGGVTSAIQTQLDAKQLLDADLTAIAALSPTNDDIIQRKSGAWANRTVAQLRADLSHRGIRSVSRPKRSFLPTQQPITGVAYPAMVQLLRVVMLAS
jgi:hypothetical protein